MQRYARGELAVVLDCADLVRAADFWAEVLGYVREGAPGPTYWSLLPPDGTGPELLLQRVEEAATAKTRLHLDLRTRDLAAETARVVAAGARLASAEPIVEGGWRWHVLTDPDGNEFCVLQPPDSYWV